MPKGVKVIDFGVARIIRREAGSEDGAEEVVAGTPAFMAPEQAEGLRDLDGRVDIYALGMILYVMLTGQVALQSALCRGASSGAGRGLAERARMLRPEVPKALDALTMRAIAKSRSERFPDATTLLAALRTAPREGAPSFEQRSGQTGRRRRGREGRALPRESILPPREPTPTFREEPMAASKRLTHFTLDGFHGFRSRFDDIKLVQEILEELPSVLGLKPVMPPFLLPYYNGVVPEDCGISAFVMLRGGHLTLHTFSFRECFFADLVAPGTFDAQRAQMVLQRTLPCRTVRSQTVVRGGDGDFGRRKTRETVDPETDFGPHLFLRFSPYRGPTTMDALFELFNTLPQKIDMTPIMRPYVLKTGTGRGGHVLSALTTIAESHISLHVYPVPMRPSSTSSAASSSSPSASRASWCASLGGNVAEQVLMSRGQRYKDLRTERDEVMGHTNRWLATTHPELAPDVNLEFAPTYHE